MLSENTSGRTRKSRSARSVDRCAPPQAHFCFICGTKILTEREKVIEQLSSIRGSFALVPENARDRFMNAVNTAIRYLEGLDES